MDVDVAFVKSRRGILKLAEMFVDSSHQEELLGTKVAAGSDACTKNVMWKHNGTLFVAFVCFAAASRSEFIVATVLEFLITLLLLLLYLLKLNKRLTFFFWPLVDVFNSVFAAVYFFALSVAALATHKVAGTVVGGVVGLVSAGLLWADSYTLSKNITFNTARTEAQNQASASK